MEARGRNRELDGHERTTCGQELKREGKGGAPQGPKAGRAVLRQERGGQEFRTSTHTPGNWEAMEETLTQTRRTMGKLESQPTVQTERGKSLGPAEAYSSQGPGPGAFIFLSAQHGAQHVCAPGQLEQRPSLDLPGHPGG